jgi:hypothetical protein
MKKTEVFIQNMDYGFAIGILLTQEINGKTYIAKPVKIEFEELNERNMRIESTMIFDKNLAPDILTALSTALDKHGVKTDNDFKIQGLLEAKDKHLEDMRVLVFGKDMPTERENKKDGN